MKHTCNNGEGPYFGRRTQGCPRCDELANGAAPIRGWTYNRDREESNLINAIRNHNCKTSNCGPICTFGDW